MRLCVVLALLVAVYLVVGATAQCSSTLTISNSTTATSAQFSLPIEGFCNSPPVDFYCQVFPPTSGAPLSVTVALRGASSSQQLCSWDSLTGAAVSQNGTLTLCDNELLVGSWSIDVSGSLSGDASLWSFSVFLDSQTQNVQLNSSTNIAAGPGMFRTYAVNLTAANGSQEVSITLAGDTARFMPAALWGSSPCAVGDDAYTWRGNTSNVAFSVSGVNPGTYYLTLLQNEHVSSYAGAQLIVQSMQHAPSPSIPTWWLWGAGVIAVLGVISFYILLEAMRAPLGAQRSRI